MSGKLIMHSMCGSFVLFKKRKDTSIKLDPNIDNKAIMLNEAISFDLNDLLKLLLSL